MICTGTSVNGADLESVCVQECLRRSKDVSAEKEIIFQAEMPQMSQFGHLWEWGNPQRPQGQAYLPSGIPEEKSWVGPSVCVG